MDKLNKHRDRIDQLDKIIMESLDERMNISREIGNIKIKNNLKLENKDREYEILKSTEKYKNSKYIKNIYLEIFKNSKCVQEYKYFLVGKSLEYSFSPQIYNLLGIDNYNLFPTEKFLDVLNVNFSGINITNPYKLEAYKICNELDVSAINTNVVNTIVRKDNKLVGYNTDFYGFSKLLEYNNVNVEKKKIIIIGNGATANTIHKVLESKGSTDIVHLVRNIKEETEFTISDFNKFNNYEIIINATPHGTYPNNQENLLFNLDNFNNLEVVIDVVYNPKSTPILRIEKENVKKINGLMMLVAQAALAASIYTATDKLHIIKSIYKKLNFDLTNIVLIGMPYSGKSIVGKKLANKLNHKLVDLDLVMEQNFHDLKTILKTNTVKEFRVLEEEYAIKYSKERGTIISTGGGIVLSSKAINSLKQNGVIVFIDTPLDELIARIDESRPLVKNKEDLINLYNERIELYKKYCDIIITNVDDINDIVEKLNEYINS